MQIENPASVIGCILSVDTPVWDFFVGVLALKTKDKNKAKATEGLTLW